MGKLKMGILGGFSGTVGTVIGSSNRKGDDIIRVKTKKPSTSNTESQANQRSKFSLVTGFMQVINVILRIGLKLVVADQMTPYNYGCQYALKNAISGEAPNFELDYNKVQISQGLLAREAIASIELTDGKVNFSWADSTNNGNCASTDKTVLLVYNVDRAEFSYSVGASSRDSKAGELSLPYYEVGDTMLFYLFFQSATDPLLVSTSQYLGSEKMAE